MNLRRVSNGAWEWHRFFVLSLIPALLVGGQVAGAANDIDKAVDRYVLDKI